MDISKLPAIMTNTYNYLYVSIFGGTLVFPPCHYPGFIAGGSQSIMRHSIVPKIHLITAVILSVTLFSSVVSAVTVSGNGTRSCGDYVGYINTGDTAGADAFISWAQGFISAYNWANGKGYDVHIDPGSLTYLLADYCRANPEKHFYEAVKDAVEQYR